MTRAGQPMTAEEYQELVAKGMHEVTLQARVRNLALGLNRDGREVLFYHTHNSKRSDPGFPDCVIGVTWWAKAPEPRMIAAELKTEKGKLTAAQIEWLTFFYHADVETYVWRPSHLLDGEIRFILSEPAILEDLSSAWSP